MFAVERENPAERRPNPTYLLCPNLFWIGSHTARQSWTEGGYTYIGAIGQDGRALENRLLLRPH